MNSRKSQRKKAIIIILIGVMLIVLFGIVMQLIEKRGELDVRFGDSGGWGNDIDETYLSLDGEDYRSLDSIDTCLVIGTDEGGENLGKAYSGEFADFLMLLIVDNTTKKYAFYTIDRNTMVPVTVVNEDGSFNRLEMQQICISHWYGLNAEQRNQYTVSAVSSLFGDLEIDSYYTMSMSDIGKLNHAVGGVTVDIESDLTKIDPAFVEGESVLLTDEQAEKYLRARYVLDDASNSARMRRQQQYLTNVYNLLMGQFRENPEYVNDLYKELEGIFESDGSAREFSVAVNHMTEYESQGFISFSGETKINDTLGDGVEHEEFYVDEASIVKNLQKVMNLAKEDDDEDDEEDDEE